MKRFISLILVLLLCLSCTGCGSSGETAASAQDSGRKNAGDIKMYKPGATIATDFGSVAVMDAAFCAKAQIYYTKSTTTHRTTVNGETTETHTETVHPGYFTAMENKLVFALKTVMTNTSEQDIEIHNLEVRARFGGDTPVYFTKGGNVHVSDEAYSILPAGTSSEIVLAALVPVEQYLTGTECFLEIGGATLGFSFDSVAVYNALGYQEGDNTQTSIDNVIQAAAGGELPEEIQEPTEPEVVEPETEMYAGFNEQSGYDYAWGEAGGIRNVAIGFRDQLPHRILTSRQCDNYIEDLTLNDTQVYAEIFFNYTNLTGETVDLADIHDDFLVQLIYDNGYQYATNTDIYAVYESEANIKLLSSRFSTGKEITVAPLASADVTLYLACAKQITENPDKPLAVRFTSKYAGNETHEFIFPYRNGLITAAPEKSDVPAVLQYPFVEYGSDIEEIPVVVHDCRMYTQENGMTRFELDYTTYEGLDVVVFANVEDGTYPAYWYEKETPTTGSRETLAFEMETELLNRTFGPDVHIRKPNGELGPYVLIWHTEATMMTTEGEPEGAGKKISYSSDGDIEVSGVTAQPLDNGYVRFTIDFNASEGRYVTFFDPPNGERFMYYSKTTTQGGEESVVLDVSQEDLKGLSVITMKFYTSDADAAWVFLEGPF